MRIPVAISVACFLGCFVSRAERHPDASRVDAYGPDSPTRDAASPLLDAGEDVDFIAPTRFESFEFDEGALLEGYPGSMRLRSGLVVSAPEWRAERPLGAVFRCPDVGWGFECEDVSIPHGDHYLLWEPIWLWAPTLTFPVATQSVRLHAAMLITEYNTPLFELIDSEGEVVHSLAITLPHAEDWADTAIQLDSPVPVRSLRISDPYGALLIDEVEW